MLLGLEGADCDATCATVGRECVVPAATSQYYGCMTKIAVHQHANCTLDADPTSFLIQPVGHNRPYAPREAAPYYYPGFVDAGISLGLASNGGCYTGSPNAFSCSAVGPRARRFCACEVW